MLLQLQFHLEKKKKRSGSLFVDLQEISFCWFMSSSEFNWIKSTSQTYKTDIFYSSRWRKHYGEHHLSDLQRKVIHILYGDHIPEEPELLVLVARAAEFFSWHCLFTIPLGRICLTLTRTEWVKQKQRGDEYKAFHCPHYISAYSVFKLISNNLRVLISLHTY